MTVYFTDMSDSPTFTERWGTGSGVVTIETSGLPSGSGTHALKIVHAADFVRYAASWDTPGTPSGDVEVLVKWQASSVATARVGLYLHGSGSSGTENAYFANNGATTAAMQRYRYVSGVSAQLTPEQTGISPALAANTWAWTRIQRTGTTFQQRTWSDSGGSEPGTWDSSSTDSSLSSGWIGVGTNQNTTTIWVAQIGVGTGGDAAPDAPVVALVDMNAITNTPTLYQPAVTPGPVSVGMDTIASTSTLYQPMVVGARTGNLVNINFETGDLSQFDATSGSPAVTSTSPIEGVYSLLTTAGAGDHATKNFTASNAVYWMMEIRYTTYPATGTRNIGALRWASGELISLRVTTAGAIRIQLGGTVLYTHGSAMGTGTDVYFRVYANRSTGDISLSQWISGAWSSLYSSTGNSISNDFSAVRVGGLNSGHEGTHRTDYVQVGTNSDIVPHTVVAASVGMNPIASTAALYQPAVAVGAVTVGMNTIASTAALYQPSVAQGAATVGMEAIAATTALYQPAATVGAVTIGMQTIASTTTLYQHVVAGAAQLVGMQTIASSATTYQPGGVTLGAVTIGMQHIASTAVVREHRVLTYTVPIAVSSGPPVVYVLVFGPLPDKSLVARIDLNVRMHSVQWDTGIGGWGPATIGDIRQDRDWGTRTYPLDSEVLVPVRAHIEIYVNGVCCYEGRAGGVRHSGTGRTNAIRAMGYGNVATKAKPFAEPNGGALVNSGVLLRQVIGECAPLLQIAGGSNWTTVDTTHDPYEWAEMYPYDALQQVVAAAGVRWAVWKDRTIYLLPATVTGDPTYHLAFSDAVEWDEDWEELATGARLTATDASGRESTMPVVGYLNASALGGSEQIISLNSTASIDVAQQWARRNLLDRSTANVAASFMLSDFQPMPNHGGGTTDQWAVRGYGEPLQIGNQAARFIETTSIDLWRGTLSGTLGQPTSGSLGALLRRTVETSNAVRTGRDALTGGRRRR